MHVNSFEDLVASLRQFTSWTGGPEYDFSGAVQLLAATVDSLHQHALDAELEDIANHLTEEQAAFLRRLGDYIKRP
jgi:hypothetical protein